MNKKVNGPNSSQLSHSLTIIKLNAKRWKEPIKISKRGMKV